MTLKKYRWYVAATLFVSFLFLIYFVDWCLTYSEYCMIEFSNGILVWWIANVGVLYALGFYFYVSDSSARERVRGTLLLGYSIYFVLYSFYAFSVGVVAPAGNDISTIAVNIINSILLIFTPYIYIYLLFLKKLSDRRKNPLMYGLYTISLIWSILFIVWLMG